MKKNRFILLLDGLLLALALCSGWIAKLMLRYLPDCYVTRLGLQCPACGGTRCIRALAALDFSSAFRYNWYFSISILLGGLYLILLNLGYVFRISSCEKLANRISFPRLLIFWAAGFVLFGLLRNLL